VPLRPGLSCIGDPDRLRQALSALLDNAIKFSPEGAAIDVSVAASDDDVLAIAIQDRGAGIAPDVLPTIFDLFVQGRPSSGGEKSGLGVGLTIAKKLAQLHGGDVSLESAGLGLGTLATLRIHREAMDEGSAGAIDGSELRSVTGSRVLIIEDNDDARESLRMLVELGDNEVRTAANATQALRIAETFEPHLVVCDLGLPDRDGYEVVEALRAHFAGRDIRYVALTGFGGAEDRDRAMDSGFDSFIVKPLQSSPP
jgi:CheY-like chemotaxis protein/anti-sigma regulatory factor (Ser/Thr protein kinase)